MRLLLRGIAECIGGRVRIIHGQERSRDEPSGSKAIGLCLKSSFNRYAEPALSGAEGFNPPSSSSPATRGKKACPEQRRREMGAGTA